MLPMEDVLTYEFFHCHFSSHQVPKHSLQVTDEPPDFLTLCKTLQDVSRGDDTQLLIFPFLWLRPRSIHLAQSHARCRPSAVPVTAGHNNSRSVTLSLPAGRSGTDPSLRRHRLSSHTARPAAMRPTAPLPGRRRGAEARPSPTLPPQPSRTASVPRRWPTTAAGTPREARTAPGAAAHSALATAAALSTAAPRALPGAASLLRGAARDERLRRRPRCRARPRPSAVGREGGRLRGGLRGRQGG